MSAGPQTSHRSVHIMHLLWADTTFDFISLSDADTAYTMRNAVFIILILTSVLAGCSPQKKLETNTPFVYGEATVEPWTAGREESASGTLVKISLSEMAADEVELQNIYFRGQMAAVSMDMDGRGMMAIATFPGTTGTDMVMHRDPTKEVGNQPPKKLNDGVFPFVLKADEAILSYLEKDKVKYAKIKGVKEVTGRIYPGRPEN